MSPDRVDGRMPGRARDGRGDGVETPGTLLLNARMRGDPLDATDEWLLGTIDRVGWAIIAVHFHFALLPATKSSMSSAHHRPSSGRTP